jgi:YD repeat-containing protein
VRAKIWADGAAEPGWMMTGTDPSPLGAGTASLYTNTWTAGTRDVTFDNVTLTTPGTGSTASTWTTYNPWNLPQDTIEASTAAHPNAADRTFSRRYDAAGQLVSYVQPGNVTITSTFDRLGRLSAQSSGAATRAFGYDLVGRTTTISHPAGTENLVYDDRGLLVGSTGPAGNTIATYDRDGRILTRNDPAAAHTYTWNTLNQLKTATDTLSAITTSYVYKRDGQPDTVTYGTAANAPKRTYTYNNAGWLASDTFTNSASTATMSASYIYDANGSVTREVLALGGNSAAGTYDYAYDRSDRLTSFARSAQPTVVYTWDDAGNRTSATPVGGAAQTWTYDARNRVTSGPEGAYTWDARGTLDKITAGAAVTYDAAFDGLGRLTAAVSGATTTTYTYDALDRVAQRSGTAFAYAGTWLDPSRVGTMRYARTPGGRLSSIKNNTAASVFAGLNRHGDLRWTFTATGATVDSNVMDPFGKPIVKTGSTNANVGFQGDWRLIAIEGVGGV